MSKKHYKALAQDIKYTWTAFNNQQYARVAMRGIVEAVCDQLKIDNPAFDRARFMTACGINE